MRFNNIDEIIKKDFKESERQNDLLVNLSKTGVWNTIEKPKKQKSLHWGFVTAMAASVILFFISVFLFLKLDSKQKELDAVHVQINQGIPPMKFPGDHPFTDEIASIRLDIRSDKLPGPMSTDKKDHLPPTVQEPKLAALTNEKGNNSETASLPMIEKKIMDFKIELAVPEFGPPELKQEGVLSRISEYEIFSQTKSKTKGKLKIRIGNGSPAHNPHHSLSFNFKL